MPKFGYQFPAIRGVMARRSYYVSMCPMRLIPKIFLFNEDEAALSPEHRAQRTMNVARVPEITRYILANRDDYFFSALTASIDGEVSFESFGDDDDSKIGTLTVGMDAKFIINDGQHRRAAIEAAIKERPELADETISIVFLIDRGLDRCQQMFADLNRYAIRPSSSIGVLYDQRDEMAKITRIVVMKSEFLRDVVELESTSLSPRSQKLFTLSAMYRATGALVSGREESSEELVELANDYWNELENIFPEWSAVRNHKMVSGEVRNVFIHSHGIALHALGKAGSSLLRQKPKDWKAKLKLLKKLDWKRDSLSTWEGRMMVNGRLSKANQHVNLASNLLKSTMGLALTESEQELESQFEENRHAKV